MADFNYTGGAQTMELIPGIYKFEVYGSQGGGPSNSSYALGGYAYGNYTNDITQSATIVVGGQNGYNGGGADIFGSGVNAVASSNGVTITCYCGGGATDIRINGSKMIIAGGGGGAAASGSTCYYGGHGGGTSGNNGSAGSKATAGKGGTQSSGYSMGTGEWCYRGSGSDSSTGESRSYVSAGGGGGYWGGGRPSYAVLYNNGKGTSSVDTTLLAGGGGGSGWVSPLLATTSNQVGKRVGNGFARITAVKYFRYNVTINDNVLHFSTVKSDVTASNIKISVNGTEVEDIVPTEDEFDYIVPKDLCTLANNKITATVTMSNGTYTYERKYVSYGTYMPEDVDVATTEFYLNALKNYIITLKTELKSVLTANKINVVEGTKMTDMIGLIDSLTLSTVNAGVLNQSLSLQVQKNELNAQLNKHKDDMKNILSEREVEVGDSDTIETIIDKINKNLYSVQYIVSDNTFYQAKCGIHEMNVENFEAKEYEFTINQDITKYPVKSMKVEIIANHNLIDGDFKACFQHIRGEEVLATSEYLSKDNVRQILTIEPQEGDVIKVISCGFDEIDNPEFGEEKIVDYELLYKADITVK